MKARSVWSVAGLVIVGLLTLLGLRYLGTFDYTFQGSLIEPPMSAYDFELPHGDADTFRLSDHRGQVVLIFFGYSNCPDFCPTTLADFNRIATELGDQAKDVTFVFVTVDPDRDTPEKVAAYASGFNPNFYGLSGTQTELEPILDAYFVYASISNVETADGYLVDHSTRTIVIDKAGEFRATFPYGLGVDAITRDIQFLLNEPVN
jgi:protein SCO1/2